MGWVRRGLVFAAEHNVVNKKYWHEVAVASTTVHYQVLITRRLLGCWKVQVIVGKQMHKIIEISLDLGYIQAARDTCSL